MSLVFRRLFSSATPAFAPRPIFVGNLAWTVKAEDLSSLFSQYGTVSSARVMSDRETGRSRGFGFVEMEEADAAIAVDKTNGVELQGRELRVNLAEPKPERPARNFGGGDRFGGDRGMFGGGRNNDRY